MILRSWRYLLPLSALCVFATHRAAAEGSPLAMSYTATTDTTLSTWKIDALHSELSFSIRHLLSRVRGQFGTWEGTIKANPNNWAGANVEVIIQVATINANHSQRNEHLRNSDFFDVKTYPTSTFKSSKIERKGDSITLNGDLTLRGVTKPVVLKGTVVGTTKEPNGKLRMGFEASTVINRKDFGVSWNSVAEAGGVTLGDEVKIDIHLSAVQQ